MSALDMDDGMPFPPLTGGTGNAGDAPWTILIIDPDDDFHRSCRTTLADLAFHDMRVHILSASGPTDARALLPANPGLAMVLLTLAPGGDGRALALIAHVRNDLRNHRMQIVACTDGTDGAFERAVVQRYEVNEFRTRSEMMGDRLCTVVIESLRAYSNALSLETNYKMMVATTGVFALKSPSTFYFNMLLQLDAMLDGGRNSLLCVRDPDRDIADFVVKAASGRFLRWMNGPLASVEDGRVVAAIRHAADSGETVHRHELCVFRLRCRGDSLVVAYAELTPAALPIDRRLVEVFRDKAASALNNLLLTDELNAVQKATVHALANIADHSDQFDSGHLRRFERMTAATAAKMLERQICPREVDRVLVEHIGLASTLHDIGLYRIPESILLNVDELMEDDHMIIRLHPKVGHEILATAATPLRGRSLLSIAADIALGHHERYDGSGYPGGLKGDAVPVSARIAGVVDVFDALVTDRVRRSAWSVTDALDWMRGRAGKEFDARVVEAFALAIADILKEEPQFFPVPRPAMEERGLGGRLAAMALRLFREMPGDTVDANLDTHR